MSDTKDPLPPRSEDGMSRRMARYAQVGTAFAGQAARLAGRRIGGGKLDRSAHAAELKAALGGLKGPLMKVAQMMATIPDALPAEYAAELAQLQTQAPPMGKPFVRRRMTTELGADWERHFAEFPLEPAAAASLGQVHKARLHDGRTVACKLQYPNMQAAVEADLNQLRIVLSIHRRFDSSIGTEKIYEELSARLREELDYSREARAIGLYGEMLGNEAHVHTPSCVSELSTQRLLTMEWLDGEPLMQFKTKGQDERDQLAMNMFRAWYVPFYQYGVIHGDPHLGNYTVRPDLDVNLLDFGCIRIFPARFVGAVIDLYNALDRDDRELAVQAYETWGFEGLSNELIDILNEWALFLYGPLLDKRKRRIQEQPSGQYGRKVAESVHQKLRETGSVTVPREFVFMDRAAIGLGSVFLHLAAEINWYELFMAMIDGFSVEALEKRQAEALGRAGFSVG